MSPSTNVFLKSLSDISVNTENFSGTLRFPSWGLLFCGLGRNLAERVGGQGPRLSRVVDKHIAVTGVWQARVSRLSTCLKGLVSLLGLPLVVLKETLSTA